MDNGYLTSVIKQFEYYKSLGEKSFDQLQEEDLFWQYNAESNSIATIVKHLHGNMISRWTDFLNSDGEKESRKRDEEFENNITNRAEMMAKWKEGWTCLLNALRSLKEDDLDKIIYIRNQGHSLTEAVNRQLAHYPYHIGQIVYIAKMAAGKWTSLSIPRGQSNTYNAEKFAQPKRKVHFTDEMMSKAKTKK
jgi:hypothetical protein